jgi:hypothetical protein
VEPKAHARQARWDEINVWHVDVVAVADRHASTNPVTSASEQTPRCPEAALGNWEGIDCKGTHESATPSAQNALRGELARHDFALSSQPLAV